MLVVTLPAFTNLCYCSVYSTELHWETRTVHTVITRQLSRSLGFSSLCEENFICSCRSTVMTTNRKLHHCPFVKLVVALQEPLNSDSQRRLRGIEFQDKVYPSNEYCFCGVLVGLFTPTNFPSTHNVVYKITIICYCKL